MAFFYYDFVTSFAKFSFLNLEVDNRRRLWLKLAKLIANGVPILQAIQTIVRRRALSHGTKDAQVIALNLWVKGMANGRRLSQVVNDWVSPAEKMLLSAGESSGTLYESLHAAVRVMDANRDIKSAIFKGVSYPLALLAIGFMILYMFSFKVVPEFTKIVPPEKFSGTAKVLILLTDFTRSWVIELAALLILSVVLFFISLPRWDGRMRIIMDRYAPYSIYRIIQGSTWLIALASMLEAGVRLEYALQQLSQNADKWLRNRVQAAISGMRSGLQLGEALLRSGYEFPDAEVIDDLGIYSSLSGFDEALQIMGREWLVDSVSEIKERMAVVFSASLILVGALVATMVGGMMSLQLQMVQAVQQKGV